jgi:WD40 repeat protein
MVVCPEHPTLALQPKKVGWYCAACDDVVVTYSEHPRDSGTAAFAPTSDAGAAGASFAASLPTLLSLPLVEVVREPVPVLALWALCDLAELALKVVVMAGIAEHTSRSGVVNPRATLPDALVNELRDHVELPTLGRWLAMAIAVAKHAPKGSSLPLSTMVASLTALLAGGETHAEEGLLPLRNRLAHAGPVGRAEAERLLSVWRPRVLAWADDALRWLVDVRLVVVDVEGRRFVLRGATGEELGAADTTSLGGNVRPPDDAPAGSAWLCTSTVALPLGPLGAFDFETRALQVYYRSGEVRLQYLRLGDDGGLCDSDVQARDRFRALFLSSSRTTAGGRRRFVIPGFAAEIRQEAARRVGREAELTTLRAAATALREGALWVAGPAGIGKSNLMAALMEEWLDHPPDDALVLPYRFRAGNDRCGRSPFLAYLRERLEASDALAPLEQKATTRDDDDDGNNNNNNNNKAAAARAAVAMHVDPVREVKELFDRLLPGRRVLLVLDGLDEVVERDARFVDDVLVRLRAARVAIVAAGRPERGLAERFARLGAVMPFPEGLPAMRDDDVRALLLEHAGPVRKRVLARDKESAGKVVNAFVDAVARRAAGLPIYVKYVLRDLDAGRLSPEQTDTLPASLHAYHDELLRRAAVGDLHAVTTPTLVLLALAYEPLSVDEIAALLVRCGKLGTTTTTQGSPAALVERALQLLGGMVRRAPDPDGDDGYTLFHHSLRTHIVDSRDVEHTVTTLRTSLAVTALRPAGDDAEVYLYRWGVRHLLDADRVEDALGLVTDFDVLMARFQRLEQSGRAVDGWYADWDSVRPRVGTLEGAMRHWWDFARTNRHSFRKEGWEPWRVLFQAAMDHADDSAVTIAAEAYEASGKRTWAWLRWVNRPTAWGDSPLLALLLGHFTAVLGAESLADGRVLSWSGDGLLALWDGQTGTTLAILAGHTFTVLRATVLADGRILSWSADHTLRLWDGKTGAPLAVLDGHTQAVRGATMLADGRVLSWSDDHTLRLWDGQTGAPLAVLDGHTEAVRGATMLADGRVLSWSEDHTLRLWDGKTGAPLAVLAGHAGPVEAATMLADGRVLSWSWDSTLRFWDRQMTATLAVAKGHTSHVRGAMVLADGRMLSWSFDHTLRLWDSQTGAALAVLKGHTGPVRGATMLADGRVVSWSADSTLRAWDGQTGAPLAVLEGHFDEVKGAMVLADGRVLSWSRDHTLRLWDGQTGAQLAVLEGHTGEVEGATMLADGRVLSWSWDATVRLWDPQMTAPLAVSEGHTNKVTDATVLADGRVLSWSWGDRTLRLWDGQTGTPLAVLKGHTDGVNGATAVADGRVLSWSNDHTLRLWDSQTGAPLAVLEAHRFDVTGATVLADGRVLSWSDDHTLRLWDSQTGAPLAVLEGHRFNVAGAMVLADGRVLSWSTDHTLRLWDGQTGALLAVLDGHTDSVKGATVLADGRVLSWSTDHTLRLWDSQTGALLAVLDGHTDFVNGATVLADGRLLTWSRDQTLRLWDGQIGAVLAVLEGHTSDVEGATMLADGRVLSWSSDHTLRLWDSQTGATLAVLEGHRSYVEGATVLADGQLLSWSWDHTLRLWDSQTGTPLAVFATPHDWFSADAQEVEHLRPHERALHHSLHDGYDVADARDDFAIFTSGRHIRFCRFVPAKP